MNATLNITPELVLDVTEGVLGSSLGMVTAPAPPSFDEVVLAERTPEFYANGHLKTGYSSTWASFQNMRMITALYARTMADLLPALRKRLSKEVTKHLPNIPQIIAPEFESFEEIIEDKLAEAVSGDCCNIELLVKETVRAQLENVSPCYLKQEMTETPSQLEYKGWELWKGEIGRDPKDLVLRTHDKADRQRLLDSINMALSDSTIQGRITELLKQVGDIRTNLEAFKSGLRGIVTAIELGSVIAGSCPTCPSRDLTQKTRM